MSKSVRRAALIIDSIAEGPKTVVELSQMFELHRSTMFRELQSLEEVGYVHRRKSGQYTLGLHLISLSKLAFDNLDLREAAHDHIRRLHKVVGNTVHLAALMESSIVYVDKVEDPNGVRMYSRIGKAVLPYCSGVGKAILADLDEGGRNAVLAGSTWEKFTEHTITSRDALDRELEIVKKQRWAADDREFEDFVNCVAVPIHSSMGVVGALSVTAIRMVQNLPQLKTHLPLMQQTAELISRELG
ncbi:transcriptional regulator, IclR family [Cryobacterium flavum]|uniref:IclR family transcriptional regulator n=1 Tax=Cryobacterium flavum TaxID=1424659 RepID=A0A4R8V6N0_9MICO|nr:MULTISPECIES: IclR family transcriptional regulator [Cryobacterium]TFB77171.1 IclR family transcriptional regulator [Cryobacterium flavum]TFD08577.1 IclR family transcriptional regulator [Cryobacterium sp. TMT1-66-1]SDN37204.1 transcriptional regulator, IclR family [Cryobacterium flavum]